MAAVNLVVDLALDGDIAVVTINSPPVNALSQDVREGLYEGLQRAFADPAAVAVVIICEGRTFIAGADIREFGKPRKLTTKDMQPLFDAAPKPVIAAMHGTALGGGLETALMAQYRVAVPSARCGLPEVNIGILPGGCGTQTLPRIVGAEAALEVITSGRHVPSAEALRLGIYDELVAEGELRAGAIAFAKKVAAIRPLPRVRDRNDKIVADRGRPELFDKFRTANARKFRGMAAPENIVKAVEAAVNLPFDEGIQRETELAAELHGGPQAPAMRYAFFAEREAAKIPDIPADTPKIPIRSVGVIGAGTMGGGIAMNFANAGIPVTLVEMTQGALDRGLAVIRKNYQHTIERGGLAQGDVEKGMGLIRGTLDMGALASADLVIEAVFELIDIKKDLFAKLDAICNTDAILATNTSGLDVNEIASATRRPESVIGLHFFSPANVMKLIEVVRGDRTSKDIVATAMALTKTIGKVAVLVGVCPGFVGNRMQYQRRQEAQAMLLEGAMPWDIDRVLYDFGFPMGVFAMSDLAGLDLGWTREQSSGSLRDLLNEMGRRGQKTGAGYYDYDEQRKARPSPVTEKIIRDLMAARGVTPRKISDEEILDRCLYPMINEGVKILAEKTAIRSSDIDVIWRYGFGWPVYRGGLMYYADQIGPANVLAKLKQFEAELGERFKPAPLLEQLVADGKTFKDI